jgi:hypothetical protein
MTLLRDWIMPQYQEENVGAPPAFATVFVENIVGLPHLHTRMLIIVGNQAAIVDAASAQPAIPRHARARKAAVPHAALPCRRMLAVLIIASLVIPN